MTKKSEFRMSDNVIKMPEERELLGRFLIIQRSRPELVPKHKETIKELEMSELPCSLFAIDGSLYIPIDKDSLMYAIKVLVVKTQSFQLALSLKTTTPPKVLVVDAMAVLQSMKKTPRMKTLSDIQEAFIGRIQWMLIGYVEGRIVFDCYLDQSLKNKTRHKRPKTCTDLEIHSQMKLVNFEISQGAFVFIKNKKNSDSNDCGRFVGPIPR